VGNLRRKGGVIQGDTRSRKRGIRMKEVQAILDNYRSIKHKGAKALKSIVKNIFLELLGNANSMRLGECSNLKILV